MFYSEHSECFANTNDQCKHGKLFKLALAFSYIYIFDNILFLNQVLCDRHYGGINYPVGGVGGIAKSLAKGLVDKGSNILYKANVTNIILDHGKAVS